MADELLDKKITWSAPEFRFYEKSGAWFLASVLVSGVIILFSLWQKNILFAIFVVIGEMMIWFWAQQEPREFPYELTEQGVTAPHASYQFINFEAFAVVNDSAGSPLAELILFPKRKVSMLVRILIKDEMIEEVRMFVKAHLAEREYHETLSEHISKLLRF
jgi:hypothetical protein